MPDLKRMRINRCSGAGLRKETVKKGVYIHGTIETPHGYVKTYADEFGSELQFIYKGWFYRRSFSGLLTSKSLVIRAKKFVEEIVNAAV